MKVSRRTSRRQFIAVGALSFLAGSVLASCSKTAPSTSKVASLPPPVSAPSATAGPTTSVRQAAAPVAASPAPSVDTPAAGVLAVGRPPAGWELTRNRGTIKGFADKLSAVAGETVTIYATTSAPTFDVEIYRLGWYDDGATQARLADARRGVLGRRQPPPESAADTGLISAGHWTASVTVPVTDWPTGLYAIKLIASDGDQNYVPFVIRDDSRRHDVVFVHAANTDQAYNSWGGKSLYAFNSQGANTVGGSAAAVKVSFDRPFDGDGLGASIPGWELNFARFLEARGFDVGYATDLDVHRSPDLAARARAVLVVGHNEYWSREMRDHLEAAPGRGVGLGFFSGDTGTWAVRYEDSPLGAARTLVCYRQADLDPAARTDPSIAAVRFRAAPLNRPLQPFIGVGSNGAIKRSANWTVKGAAALPDLFAETGLKDGDVVPNLIGYEYDGRGTRGATDTPPAGLCILGSGTVEPDVASPDITESGSLEFAVQYPFAPGRAAPVGRIQAEIQPAGPWILYVHVTGTATDAYLQYQTGNPTTRQAGPDQYRQLPLGDAFPIGRRTTFDRDVRADFAAAFGRPAPANLRVDRLQTRGSLSIVQLRLVGPDGVAVPVPPVVDPSRPTGSWRVIAGKGTATVDGQGSGATLVVTPEASDLRGDEADSVAIRASGKGMIVAVGTIQWSWALDDFGAHQDSHGNVTQVHPGIQALTANLVRALVDSPRIP